MQKFSFRSYILTACLVLTAFILYVGKTFAEDSVLFRFEPEMTSLSESQTITLKANAGVHNVKSVRVEFDFDKTKVNLSGEIDVASEFGTKTSIADANATGHVSIQMNLSSQTGDFEIARIPLTVISNTNNDVTILLLDEANIQVIDVNNEIVDFSIENPIYILNYISGSVSPSVVVTSTAAHTSTPSSTVTPLGIMTATPTRMPTGTGSSPTITPTASVTPSEVFVLTSTLSPTSTIVPSVTPPVVQRPEPKRFREWCTRILQDIRSRFSFFWSRN
jgi:hypothetical protein